MTFPRYYLALHPDPASRVSAPVFVVEKDRVYRNDGSHVSFDVPANTVDPSDVIKKQYPAWSFVRTRMKPGECYPRMARTTAAHLKDSPGWHPGNEALQNVIQTSQGQMVALLAQLESILRTVHPTTENFNAYGHDIRNLLILAATEVEAHWKGVLTANQCSAFNTNDYVELLPAMRLSEYSLELSYYPWLSALVPFQNWDATAPTKSLSWYDAYNAVKHDREGSFKEATLFRAILAVCACAVMIKAQFGMGGYTRRRGA